MYNVCVNKKEIIMKPLNQTQNKHFYESGKGCIFNGNLENCICYVEPFFNYQTGEEESVKFYASGALFTFKKQYNIDIFFVKNDGKKLFEHKANGTFKTQNNIYDINTVVCDNGVLVTTQHHDGTFDFDYYLYNGIRVYDCDIEKLKSKIGKIEKHILLMEKTRQLEDETLNNLLND